MNRLVLTLLLSPTFFGLVLPAIMVAHTANAAEPIAPANELIECESNAQTKRFVCERVSRTSNFTRSNAFTKSTPRPTPQAEETPMLEFSEEESDAAVEKFGCDCLVCINAIRQARGLPPVG